MKVLWFGSVPLESLALRSLPVLPFVPRAPRAAALEAAFLTGHLLLYPTGIRPEPCLTPPSPEHGEAPRMLPTEGRNQPPVVLLHGFIDNRSAFVLMRRSLARGGWRHVIALNHSPLTGDIREAAERLAERIEEICALTGHRRIDVIGHSLGGLIARYYVQRMAGDSRVRTLVTLGTPHSGTRVAPLLSAVPIVRQLRPDSDLMTELAGPAKSCRTRFVCFWSDVDQLMVPAETARLDHPDLDSRDVQVHGVGHISLPAHWAVASRIRRELLAKGIPTTESSAGVA